jgi:two-component system response regulator HupR/HoxA
MLRTVKKKSPTTETIMITAFASSTSVIKAMKSGAFDYINKPFKVDEILLTIEKALKNSQLQRENLRLHQELEKRFGFDNLIGKSPAMKAIYEIIKQVAPTKTNILICGESGTGKELCARALHYNSLRQDKAFVAENCGAVPDELLESELFGHKRGAFTGASEDRIGLFELANHSTIFLDEIGETSPAFQVKLLRVLQENEIRPLGSNKKISINVRVIAATNRNLAEDVRQGKFRKDLYYRLATFEIHIPPLRDRKDDIAPLAIAMLNQAMDLLGKRVKGISEEALLCFESYQWPGNVREMQNEIKRMLVLCQTDYLGSELVSPHILHAIPEESVADMAMLTGLDGSLKERVEALEARILKETLIRLRWNKTQAAKELGLSRVGLRNKMERYGLEKNTSIEPVVA